MKGMIQCVTSPNKFFMVVVAFLISIFFTANGVMAASGEKNPSAKAKASHVERTEARIKKLHQTLKITPAQEELWNALAEAMRENAKTMDTLIQARRAEKGKPMNALEGLKSYSEILDAHAEGLKKFITAFEPLYNAMSDEQKKNADTIFQAGRHGKSKKK